MIQLLSHIVYTIPIRTPLAICNFIFAEEANSGSRNLQHIVLASVNVLFLFTKIFHLHDLIVFTLNKMFVFGAA